MKNKFRMIEESLNEFAKRGRPRKDKTPIKKIDDVKDAWYEPDEDDEVIGDIDIDTSDMDNAEEIEIEENTIYDKLLMALSNELKMPEFNRAKVDFTLKDDDEIHTGVPMAKLSDNAFLFKLEDGKMKKIFLKDIIVESKKSNRAKCVNEDFNADSWDESDEFGLHIGGGDNEECKCDDIDEFGKCRKCGKKYIPEED